MPDMTCIQIPGQATFWRSYDVPPVTIQLPLRAFTRPISLIPFIILCVCLILVFSMTLLLIPFDGDLKPYYEIGINKSLFILSIVIFSFCIMLYLAAVAVNAITDVMTSDAVIEIDANGLRDSRLGVYVALSSIEYAELARGRHVYGVRLTLKQQIDYSHTNFRVESIIARFQNRDTLLVPVRMLDVDPYTVLEVIKILVEQYKNAGAASG